MTKPIQKTLSIILMLVSVASLAADKEKNDQDIEDKNPSNQIIILLESAAYTPPRYN
jgi:hypothetical protein